jgi:large subunit ribosomal protein L10
MPSQKNIEQVAAITSRLEQAEVAVLTGYEGLTVADMVEFRDKLREANVQYTVYKNRLIQVSAASLGIEGLEPYLHETTAIATSDDPASLTKILLDFSTENENLKIKGGIIGGQVIDQATTQKLVDMPTKGQLKAQVAGSLKAPIYAIAQVLSAPMRDLAGVVNALSDQPRKLASLLQAVADQKAES